MFLVDMFQRKTTLPTPAEALAGREDAIETASTHYASGKSLKGPYPDGVAIAYFAMGRFAASEPLFWSLPGVHVTAVGYAGGLTPNPTYKELMSSLTGHAQTVMVVFDPAQLDYDVLLTLFFENHDPTQNMRQGNDIGTVFRSMILTANERQMIAALAARDVYQAALKAAGHTGKIVTDIAPLADFYFAESNYQQQGLRNATTQPRPKGTGVAFPAQV